MPSKHIYYISEGAEQHVSYHFDTIQEMIEFERFLQENTFEKYQQDQKIALDLTESAMKKFQSLPESSDEISSCEGKPCPWIIDWENVEEDFGPEYKWFAVDEDGETWVYTGRPKHSRDEEGESYGRFYPDCYDRTSMVQQRHIIQKRPVPWNESLLKKPEKS